MRHWLKCTQPDPCVCVECPEQFTVNKDGDGCDCGEGNGDFDRQSNSCPNYKSVAKGGLSVGATVGIVVALLAIITAVGVGVGCGLKKKVDKEAELRDIFEMKRMDMDVHML